MSSTYRTYIILMRTLAPLFLDVFLKGSSLKSHPYVLALFDPGNSMTLGHQHGEKILSTYSLRIESINSISVLLALRANVARGPGSICLFESVGKKKLLPKLWFNGSFKLVECTQLLKRNKSARICVTLKPLARLIYQP